MALDKWSNTGLSTLASGIDASQTTLTVASGTGSRFPADTFNVVIWNSTDFANPIDAADREIVRCTSRSGDVLTIVRGQEGTTGITHNTAGKTYSVALIVSQKFRDDLQNADYWDAAPATPVANRLYKDTIVKGWVRFRVDGTIDDDVNVSSVIDNGTGDWTVNWAMSFANANYIVLAKTTLDSGVGPTSASVNNDNIPTAAAAQIISIDTSGALRDPDGVNPRIFVLAIGDQ